jgi:hypothetical protein
MCVKERVCKSVGNISLSLSLSPSLSLSLSLSLCQQQCGRKEVPTLCLAIVRVLEMLGHPAHPVGLLVERAPLLVLLGRALLLPFGPLQDFGCLPRHLRPNLCFVLFCFVTTTTSQSQCTGRHLDRACLQIWKNAWRCWKIAPRLAPSPLQNGFLRWGWEGLTPSVEGEEADNPCVSKTMESPPVSRPIPEKPSASNPTMTTRDSAPAAN